MVTPYLSRLRPAESGPRLHPRPRSRFEPAPTLPIDGPAVGAHGVTIPAALDAEAAGAGAIGAEIGSGAHPPGPQPVAPPAAPAEAAGQAPPPAGTAAPRPDVRDEESRPMAPAGPGGLAGAAGPAGLNGPAGTAGLPPGSFPPGTVPAGEVALTRPALTRPAPGPDPGGRRRLAPAGHAADAGPVPAEEAIGRGHAAAPWSVTRGPSPRSAPSAPAPVFSGHTAPGGLPGAEPAPPGPMPPGPMPPGPMPPGPMPPGPMPPGPMPPGPVPPGPVPPGPVPPGPVPPGPVPPGPVPPGPVPPARPPIAQRRHADSPGQEPQAPGMSALRPATPPAGDAADHVQAIARWLRAADAAPVRAGAVATPAMGRHPLLTSPGRAAVAAPQPEVTLSIGRIEVRAPAPNDAPPRPRSSASRRQAPSLDDYLEARTRAQGRPG